MLLAWLRIAGIGQRQTRCAPSIKSPNYVGRAPQPNILEGCSREARGVAFRTEDDHVKIMVGRDRQPRARGRVEPPLEHVTFDNQCARNTALTSALAFGPNIDEYGLRFCRRLIGLLGREPPQSGTRR